ncbi:MAG: ABC transporter permease [Clostridia bacterium]|nr:ABC transporter permease [Clostridia bacterium]
MAHFFSITHEEEPHLEIMKLFNAMPGAVSQGIIWGIMAIGVYVTYRILDLADLTVDGSIATGGAVAAMLIVAGWDPALVLVIAFLVGMLAGLITGVLHTNMGIPAILAGILTQLALYSINLRIMNNKANTSISVNKYDLLISSRYVRNFTLDNPIPLLLIITVVLIIMLYWFFGTEYGCSLRATGSNANMARAQGINTNLGKVFGLMLSNGIVALSGALLTQYQGFADVSMGRGAIVIGLAAVIIGEVVFGKLFRNFAMKLVAVSLGAVIYYMVIQVVLWLGLNTNDLKMLTALVVALFLAIPHWKAKLATSQTMKKGEQADA